MQYALCRNTTTPAITRFRKTASKCIAQTIVLHNFNFLRGCNNKNAVAKQQVRKAPEENLQLSITLLIERFILFDSQYTW